MIALIGNDACWGQIAREQASFVLTQERMHLTDLFEIGTSSIYRGKWFNKFSEVGVGEELI